jgi:hypothetical protein
MLHGKDELQLVLEHVGYNPNTGAATLSYRSPMLSFCPDPDKALEYANRKRRELTACELEEASHFVWRLDVDHASLKQMRPGCYELAYKSDPKNCIAIIGRQLQANLRHEAATGDAVPLAKAVGGALGAGHASRDVDIHQARLFHVSEFVSASDFSKRDRTVIQNTLERAKRDDEWLLYPCDPMPDGKGVSARFLMNEMLSVHASYKT